jgi:hypothetical protein
MPLKITMVFCDVAGTNGAAPTLQRNCRREKPREVVMAVTPTSKA